MNERLGKIKKKTKTLYNFCSAKKIFLMRTPNKYLLIEKKNNSKVKPVSLTKRNITISNKNSSMIFFPNR